MDWDPFTVEDLNAALKLKAQRFPFSHVVAECSHVISSILPTTRLSVVFSLTQA